MKANTYKFELNLSPMLIIIYRMYFEMHVFFLVFKLLTYVENAFIGSGKCGGVKTEEALAEELMIL